MCCDKNIMALSDNKRYRDMELAPGVFVPDVGMEYPEDDPLARLVPFKKKRDLKFDETYPFLEDTFAFKLQRHLAYFLVFGPYYLVNWLKYGINYEGRGILKKYRKEFADGVVSVSNHCYALDGMCIAEALRHRLWIPMLADHFNGSQYWHLKYFGGIPLSDGSISATKKFNEAFDVHHARKEWIHVFAEARSWLFYKPLRPFQKGAFTWAYKWNVPVLPMALTFRPRTGIHKLFGSANIPLVTVKIGEPIFPDTTQLRKTEVERLCRETHAAVCSLAGIVKNSWPAMLEDMPSETQTGN